MKVDYVKIAGGWYWFVGDGKAQAIGAYYTRRRDAVRGFERFCAAIKKAEQNEQPVKVQMKSPYFDDLDWPSIVFLDEEPEC